MVPTRVQSCIGPGIGIQVPAPEVQTGRYSVVQGPNLLVAFVNKVLLEHSHAHLGVVCGAFFLQRQR